MQQPILHPVSDLGVFLGRTKCTIALQVVPDGQPIRRLSPSSSIGSSDLHKSNPWMTVPGSGVGPDSAVNQPAPTSKVDDTSTSKAQAPEAGGSHLLSQQTHGGAKAEGASRRENHSEFQKPEGASAPAAEAATKDTKASLVPIPIAWFKSKALQPTAAVFDPTAVARQLPQAQPIMAQQQGPSGSQEPQSPGEEKLASTQPSKEEDQGTKRSRRDQSPKPQNLHADEKEDLPQQQRPGQEDSQVTKSQRASTPAPAEEAAEGPVRHQGSGPDMQDVQMARSRRESSPAEDDEQAQVGQHGSTHDVEDVHMMGTTPPSSSGMQHLAAVGDVQSSSRSVSTSASDYNMIIVILLSLGTSAVCASAGLQNQPLN